MAEPSVSAQDTSVNSFSTSSSDDFINRFEMCTVKLAFVRLCTDSLISDPNSFEDAALCGLNEILDEIGSVMNEALKRF